MMRNDLRWALAAIILLVTAPARAQRPQCPPAPNLQASTTSVATKVAADALTKVLGNVGINLDVNTTRASVLKDNPRADQAIIVLTMANTLCEMLWADATLSGAQKSERYLKMMAVIFTPAAGPIPIARTDDKHSFDWAPRVHVLLASTAALAEETETEPRFKLPTPGQSGLLRDPPFYVNDSNKYFVIVGSPGSRDEGLRLLKQFKAKAPQYDFALYEPYGSNTHYGIMMATWVPRDVAMEALRLARRDVSADAYVWACRGTGETC